jgi:uncharacterized RDD family membrane protein YckC
VADLGHESILGLDNIRLELPVAGVGSRSLAASLDYLILGALMVLWALFSVFAIGALSRDLGAIFFIVGWFVLEWSYFAGFEIGTGGRTPGKMALRLRVVTAEGGSAGAGALMMRNLVRTVDLIFGVPLMAVDPLSRRLGDRLAGTLVVHDRGREAAPVLGRVPPGWGPRELAAVESFLARAATLEDTATSWAMADRILDRIRRDAPELLAGVDTRGDPVAALRHALQAEEG